MNLRQSFLTTGHIEGVSYLVLLFVAMPFKYFLGMPEAVRITGSIHGILFVLFVGLLILMKERESLSLKTTAALFAASLVPFGTFFLNNILAWDKK